MRHKLLLFPLLLTALLVAACSDSIAQPSPTPTPPSLTSGIRVLLVPAVGTGTPSQVQLDTVRAILSQRLAGFGLKNARVSQLVPASQLTLVVEVPHFGGDERGTLATLLQVGLLEFWDTGTTSLQKKAPFDPTQFTTYNPGGKPLFTGADLDTNHIAVSTNTSTSQPVINFAMQGSAVGRFSDFTGTHIGDYLTITLDRVVIVSPQIQSAIPGAGQIDGQFTLQEATALANVLKYPALPVALQISSEEIFTT